MRSIRITAVMWPKAFFPKIAASEGPIMQAQSSFAGFARSVALIQLKGRIDGKSRISV